MVCLFGLVLRAAGLVLVLARDEAGDDFEAAVDATGFLVAPDDLEELLAVVVELAFFTGAFLPDAF